MASTNRHDGRRWHLLVVVAAVGAALLVAAPTTTGTEASTAETAPPHTDDEPFAPQAVLRGPGSTPPSVTERPVAPTTTATPELPRAPRPSPPPVAETTPETRGPSPTPPSTTSIAATPTGPPTTTPPPPASQPVEEVLASPEEPATGTLVIAQQILPADGSRFAFVNEGLDPRSFELGDGESRSWSPPAGIYRVGIVPDPAYTISIICVDPDGQTTTDEPLGIADLDIDAGETVTCTFVSTALIDAEPEPAPECVAVDQRLRAPGMGSPNETAPVLVTLPPGRYRIEITIRDPHHRPEFQTDQREEQAIVEVFDPDMTLVYASSPTVDLADDETESTQTVATDVELPEIASFVVRHAGSGQTPDSFDVVCVRFVPLD